MTRARALIILFACACACAGASGCAEEERSIFVGYPDLGLHRSGVLAVSGGGSPPGLWAFSIASGAPSDPAPSVERTSEDEPVRAELLLYDLPLSDRAISLAPGALAEAAPGGPSRALPDAKAVLAAEIDPNETAVEWSSASASAGVLAFRIQPAASPCAEFDKEGYGFEAESNLSFAIDAGGGRALVGLFDEHVFLVDVADGRAQRVSLPAGRSFYSVHREPSGRLWLGSFDGELWSGTLTTTTGAPSIRASRVSTSSTGGALRWIAGGPGAAGLELYTISHDRVLERFDASAARWTVLHRFDTVPGDRHSALAWIGAGELVAASPAARAGIVRVRGDTVTFEQTPPDTSIVSVAYVAGLGTVAGTARGEVLIERDGVWEPIGAAPLLNPVHSLAAYDGGFIAAGTNGNLAQYHPMAGFCDRQQPFAFAIKGIVVVGRDVLLAGDNPSTPSTPFGILRRRP